MILSVDWLSMETPIQVRDVVRNPEDEMDEDEAGDGQDDEVQEVTFEPFEQGNVWTQKVSTQIYRSAWRRQVYMEDEPSQAVIVNCRGSPTSSAEGQGIPSVDGEVVEAFVEPGKAVRSGDDDEDAEIPDANHRQQDKQPWWSKGKTAPLLDDFDSDRRLFYFAQAGIASSSTTHAHHSEEGRLARVSPVRAALTLASNANSPCGAGPAPFIAAITPRKKTWDAIWGKDGERSVSNKKQATSTNMRQDHTPTQARRGRGRGRGKSKWYEKGVHSHTLTHTHLRKVNKEKPCLFLYWDHSVFYHIHKSCLPSVKGRLEERKEATNEREREKDRDRERERNMRGKKEEGQRDWLIDWVRIQD
jgi:hypothetical protein